jgi:hypothetical protein
VCVCMCRFFATSKRVTNVRDKCKYLSLNWYLLWVLLRPLGVRACTDNNAHKSVHKSTTERQSDRRDETPPTFPETSPPTSKTLMLCQTYKNQSDDDSLRETKKKRVPDHAHSLSGFHVFYDLVQVRSSCRTVLLHSFSDYTLNSSERERRQTKRGFELVFNHKVKMK